MKRLVLALAALIASAAPAAAQVRFIGPDTGASFHLGRFGNIIPFWMVDDGGTSTFTVTLTGMVGMDPRSCANYPAGQVPAACDHALYPIRVSEAFDASDSLTRAQFLVPILGAPTDGGWLNFSPTDHGRIAISLAALAPGNLPEPQTWASMMLGLAVIGAALRRRPRFRRARRAGAAG